MAIEVPVTDYPMFIDGASVPSSSGRWIEVRSPATRETVGRVPDGTAEDVDRAVAAARAAFRDGRWRRIALADRVAIMNRLGDLLDRDADELARLETLQTGTAYKLRRDSDFAFASDNLRFFATQIRINDHLMVTSEMPHGGFKQSGSGKDMSSYSFEEYTQVKHVMLELTGEPEKGWHFTIFGDKPEG